MAEDVDDLFDDEENDHTRAEVTPASSQTPDAVRAPEIEPQAGIMQGLAKTIPAGGTTLLAISRLTNGSLLVSIQPARAKDEDASTALPLQIKGAPDEIDRELLRALAHYVPARQYVFATAEETARATVTAVAAKAAEAKKTTPTSAARSTATAKGPKAPAPVALRIDCKPAFAKVTVADASGKQIAAVSGSPVNLAPGTYTISAAAAKHDTHTETIELRAQRTVLISLTESAPAFAFVGAPT